MEINLSQQEATLIVGCLKICSTLDSGVDKLDKIADRITKAYVEELKRSAEKDGSKKGQEANK